MWQYVYHKSQRVTRLFVGGFQATHIWRLWDLGGLVGTETLGHMSTVLTHINAHTRYILYIAPLHMHVEMHTFTQWKLWIGVGDVRLRALERKQYDKSSVMIKFGRPRPQFSPNKLKWKLKKFKSSYNMSRLLLIRQKVTLKTVTT